MVMAPVDHSLYSKRPSRRKQGEIDKVYFTVVELGEENSQYKIDHWLRIYSMTWHGLSS